MKEINKNKGEIRKTVALAGLAAIGLGSVALFLNPELLVPRVIRPYDQTVDQLCKGECSESAEALAALAAIPDEKVSDLAAMINYNLGRSKKRRLRAHHIILSTIVSAAKVFTR